MKISTAIVEVEINYTIDAPDVRPVSTQCSPRPKLNIFRLCRNITPCPNECPDMSDPSENDCAILFAAFVSEQADDPNGICLDTNTGQLMSLCECVDSRVDTYCSNAPEHQWIKPLFSQWVRDHWHEWPSGCCSRNFKRKVREELNC